MAAASERIPVLVSSQEKARIARQAKDAGWKRGRAMGVTDKLWDAITTVIRMNDKIERMADTIKSQQQKIESMTERLMRLELALELGMARRSGPDQHLLDNDHG